MNNQPIKRDELLELISSLDNYIMSIARPIANDATDECANEARLIAVKKIDAFRGSNENEFRGWIRTIVVNVCLGHLRKQKRRREEMLNESEITSGGASPSQDIRLMEERQKIVQMLDDLLEIERDALVLRYFENWSIDQIAAQLQRTPSAIGGILYRALQKLRSDASPSDWSRILGN